MTDFRARALVIASLATLILSGFLVAGSSAAPAPVPQQNSIPLAGDWGSLGAGWTMFHGGITQNGSYPGDFTSSHFRVRWQENLTGLANARADDVDPSPVQASPIAFNGSIYIPESDDGNVVELNASTGIIENYYDVVGSTDTAIGTVSSTPTIMTVGGVPYLVEATETGGAGGQYIVSIDLNNGTASYCKVGGDNIVGGLTPVPGKTVAVAAANNRDIWIPAGPLNNIGTGGACTAANQGGVGSNGGSRYVSTPSVGFVYPTGAATYYLTDYNNKNNQVDSFTASSGFANGWQSTLNNPVSASLALTNVSYNESVGGPVVAPIGFIVDEGGAGATSYVYAVDVSANPGISNNNVGSYALPSHGSSDNGANTTVTLRSLSPTSTMVIYATQGGNLSGVTASVAGSGFPSSTSGYSIDWSGSWNYSTGYGFAASPVVAGNLLMDGNTNGSFYILNTSDTNAPLVFTGHFNGTFLSSPAIYDQNVYILTSTGELSDIGPATPLVAVTIHPSSVVGGGQTVGVTVAAYGVGDTGSYNLAGIQGANLSLYFEGGAHPSFTPIGEHNANSHGKWTFPWTSPVVNSNITYLFVAHVTAAGYSNSAGNTTILVTATTVVPKPLSLAVSPESPLLTSGETTQVNFTVTSGGAPVSSAVIAIFSPGSNWTSMPNPTNSNGMAYANYTAPDNVSSSKSILLGAVANISGYSNASGYSTITLMSSPMTLEISPVIPSLSPGELTEVNFTVMSGNLPVAGAAITLTSPPAANWTTAPGLTNSNGQAWGNLTAPDNIPSSQSVLLSAMASARGYSNATGYSSVVLTPTVKPGTMVLLVTVSPLSVAVAEGGTSQVITVTVTNDSSSKAVAGATVVPSLSDKSLGAFNTSSESSQNTGKATFTFTGVLAGTSLASFSATFPSAIGGSASMAISVEAPSTSSPSLQVTAAPSEPTATPGSSVSFTVQGSEVNSTTGQESPAAGATVEVDVLSDRGSASSSDLILNSTGWNDSLTVTTSLSSSAYLLQVAFTITLSGASTGASMSSVAVAPSELYVAASVGSQTIEPNDQGTLSVDVTSEGLPLSGATVNVTSPSSDIAFANISQVTGSSGKVTFTYKAGSETGTSIVMYVTVSRSGFITVYNSSTIYVPAPPTTKTITTSSGPTTYFGLSLLDWILLVLVIVLLIALVAVLLTKNGRPSTKGGMKEYEEERGTGGGSTEEAAAAGAVVAPQAVGTAVPEPTPSAAIRESEWREDAEPAGPTGNAEGSAPEQEPPPSSVRSAVSSDSQSMDADSIMASRVASEQSKGVYGGWSSEEKEGSVPPVPPVETKGEAGTPVVQGQETGGAASTAKPQATKRKRKSSDQG